MPDIELVVHNPFGPHVRGSVITEAAEIEAVLASEHAERVVKRHTLAAPEMEAH